MMTRKLLYFLILLSTTLSGQNSQKAPNEITRIDVYNGIYEKIKDRLAMYCGSDENDKGKISRVATSDGAFAKQSRVIFNTVVTGNKDAVNNGSAFAYSQDKDKHKFSANMTFADKDWKRDLIEVGTNITSADDNFKYYSKGKWSSDIGVKVGYNMRLSTSQYYIDTTCANISEVREIAMRERLAKIKEALKLNRSYSEQKKEIQKLNDDQLEGLKYDKETVKTYKKDIDELYKQLAVLKDIEKIIDTAKAQEAIVYRQFEKEFKANKSGQSVFVATEEQWAKIKNARDSTVTAHIKEYVDKMLTEFDVKNNPFHGYRIWWWNLNANAANSPLSIKGDTLMVEDIQKRYTGRLKSNIESSINLSHVGLLTIQYFKFYTSLNQHSFLDSPNLLDNILKVVPNQNDNILYYNIVDEENNIIARYDHIRESQYSWDIGIVYSIFGLFDKTLGAIVKANWNVPAFHNIGIPYDQNYTLLAGPAFRVASKSEWSSATFTITTGVERQLADVGDWGNRFVVKASVGIPFTIFEKSKPEAK
ncbi:hypothetical protein [Flavobacterium luteolum]|uniref:hypothetical protein n=1 Tax=Flavobacterium luteolum TaxID=3003259 RepID=UPI00248DE092|nr:hypothetical protein [Flavobacterium luteolum]